ncbi:MAG: leucyl aminopeptidase, partial [Elusimicrobia bacterium]|nr:leucyl aminopeptidase [Elusimicrobiota bacterium]
FKGEKETLAFFCWQDQSFTTDGWLEPRKDRALGDWAKREAFAAKKGETLLLYPQDSEPAQRLLLVGLGPKKEFTLNALREAAATAFQTGKKRFFSLWATLPDAPSSTFHPEEMAQALAEGLWLASYQFTSYRKASSEEHSLILKKMGLVATGPQEAKSLEAPIRKAQIFAEATGNARDWVNIPPSEKNPGFMISLARKISGVTVRVFHESQLRKMGMGGILGVARGSTIAPAFLHLIYKPKGSPKKRLGLAGKGVLFDSGGLSLKPAAGMEDMKMDMAGAAAVLAVLKALPKLGVHKEVHGFIPLTYNMPGGDATKPGDVLKAFNGKTIEVLNTDAEGRLILADALSFACAQKLDGLVDIATLTGAALVAVGHLMTAAMTNNPELLKGLTAASEKAGEKIWELPLPPEYRESLKSHVADLRNVPKNHEAGTILGGMFLQEFVDQTPWVHLDIAGTAWTSEGSALCPPGATGAPVRTLLEYLLH